MKTAARLRPNPHQLAAGLTRPNFRLMPPSTFDWVTFGIAVVGVSLSVIGLGWQIVSWTWTGSRVKVETRLSSVEVPLDGGPTWVDVFEVIARNKGRTAVDVM